MTSTPPSKAWFPEVNHLFCLLRILEWHGGKFDASLLNNLILKREFNSIADEIFACCKTVGLDCIDQSRMARLRSDATLLYHDKDDEFSSICMLDDAFVIYKPNGKECEYRNELWRDEPGGWFFEIEAKSPVKSVNQVLNAPFQTIENNSRIHSSELDCRSAKNLTIVDPSSPNDPYLLYQIISERIDEAGRYLDSESTLSTELIAEIHLRLATGVIINPGQFRTIGLMRGGVIFTHPTEIERHLKAWCGAANEFRSRVVEDSEVLAHNLAGLFTDFLNIHPFIDFNGKIARLLLAWLSNNPFLSRINRELGKRHYYASLYEAGRGDLRLLQVALLALLHMPEESTHELGA